MDCAGTCVASSSEVAGWIGDGSCDNGRYGYFFNCPALGCDGGDCSASECTMGDPGEVCMFGIFSGEASDQYWIFGDVFLRTVSQRGGEGKYLKEILIERGKENVKLLDFTGTHKYTWKR